MRRPLLTIKQILAWVDAWFTARRLWPLRTDGRIPGSWGETWCAIDQALRKCGRGLSCHSSLAQLLQERRGVRNRMRLPKLTIKLILAWADDHYRRTRRWPHANSGPVLANSREHWSALNCSLKQSHRGLTVNISLAQLLAQERGVRSPNNLPPLTPRLLLRWARSYYHREGCWPKSHSGPIPETPGETWARVNTALVQGDRGWPGGSSLARFLEENVGSRNRKHLPPLTIPQIVRWADAH
jgi:hypothetical protein